MAPLISSKAYFFIALTIWQTVHGSAIPDIRTNATSQNNTLGVKEHNQISCGVGDRYVVPSFAYAAPPRINQSDWDGLSTIAKRLSANGDKVLFEYSDSENDLVLDLQMKSPFTVNSSDIAKCLDKAYAYGSNMLQNRGDPLFEGGLQIWVDPEHSEEPVIYGSFYLQDGARPLNSVFGETPRHPFKDLDVTATYPTPARRLQPQWQIKDFILKSIDQMAAYEGSLDDLKPITAAIGKDKIALNIGLVSGDDTKWDAGIQGKAASTCLRLINSQLPERYVYESSWTCYGTNTSPGNYHRLGTYPTLQGSFRVVKDGTPFTREGNMTEVTTS